MAAIASVTSYEYAAGTCTLRLVGELSPLSQVTGRPVLGRSRFHLQIQTGDGAAEPGAAAGSRAIAFELSGREPQFSALAELVHAYVQRYLSGGTLGAAAAVAHPQGTLQPLGLSRHRLTLSTPPQTIELSTLQLSDLADILEQAEGSLQLVPDGGQSSIRRRPRLPLWIGSVAAVGIAALLGNQLLTNAPPAVVVSPEGPQPASESTAPPPPASGRPPAEGVAPGADGGSANTGRPDTDRPDTRTESPQPPPTANRSEPAIAPSPAAPSANAGLEPRDTARAPSPAPSAAARRPEPPPTPSAPASGQAAPADVYQATEQAPAAADPSALRSAPAQDNLGAAIPEAAPAAVDSDWLLDLSDALGQQWRPPANLAATLRYRLTLAPDGTVMELVPLNDFSAGYQSNATLPQPGSVIPGAARDRSTTVDVQFLPTGEVIVTLPEAAVP